MRYNALQRISLRLYHAVIGIAGLNSIGHSAELSASERLWRDRPCIPATAECTSSRFRIRSSPRGTPFSPPVVLRSVNLFQSLRVSEQGGILFMRIVYSMKHNAMRLKNINRVDRCIKRKIMKKVYPRKRIG